MEKEGKSVIRHAAIYLLARGLPGIIMFLAIPVFTRLLNPAEYGRYALVIATASLLNALLFQWLRLSLVRYLPAFKEDGQRLKSTLLTVQCLLVLGAGICAGAAAVVPSWRAVAVACWAVLAVQAPFELFCEYTRSKIRPWRYMGMQVTRAGLSTGLGALCIVLGMGWWGPLLGMSVGMLLPVLIVYRQEWAGTPFTIDRAALSTVCKYGIPLSITVALAVVISCSDRFLIAWFLGDEAAGLYSVAVDFTGQTLTLLMLVINLAMFPLAVRALEHRGREAAQEQMRHNAALLLAVGVPATVALSVLAPSIAYCFLGKSYRAAAIGIIPMVALGTFLAGFKAFHLDAAFQFAHKTIYQVWIVLIAAVVNVALNLAFIRHFGINGAATASVIAYLVSIALTAWYGRRHFTLPFPLLPFAQVMLGSAVMAVILFTLRPYRGGAAVAVQVAAGAAGYGITLLSLNFLGARTFVVHKFQANRGSPEDPVGAGATAALE